MDWSEKVQEMMQSWTRSQQKMWSGWLETMQRMGRSPTTDLWARTIDTWQASVNNTLDAQSAWMQTWAESFGEFEGAPDSVRAWATRSKVGMRQWNDAQRRLWENWFSMLRESAPDNLPLSPDEVERQLEQWRHTAQEAMDAQLELVASWLKGTEGP